MNEQTAYLTDPEMASVYVPKDVKSYLTCYGDLGSVFDTILEHAAAGHILTTSLPPIGEPQGRMSKVIMKVHHPYFLILRNSTTFRTFNPGALLTNFAEHRGPELLNLPCRVSTEVLSNTVALLDRCSARRADYRLEHRAQYINSNCLIGITNPDEAAASVHLVQPKQAPTTIYSDIDRYLPAYRKFVDLIDTMNTACAEAERICDECNNNMSVGNSPTVIELNSIGECISRLLNTMNSLIDIVGKAMICDSEAYIAFGKAYNKYVPAIQYCRETTNLMMEVSK